MKISKIYKALFPCQLRAALLVTAIACVCAQGAMAQADTSTKAERNMVKDGNKAFNAGNYQRALDLYEQALVIAPTSEAALFNKAVALTRLSNAQDSTMLTEATKLFNKLGSGATNTSIKEKANYNLGNIAFNGKEYKQSIDYYKKVLRSNPSNRHALENLRVAQLKLPPEDQNQQQQQQNQQQQQEQQQQQQQQQPQQQQQQQQNGNADQILQSMQNRENRTRKDTQKKEVNVAAPVTDKPW